MFFHIKIFPNIHLLYLGPLWSVCRFYLFYYFILFYFILFYFILFYLFIYLFIYFYFFKSLLVACPTHTNPPGSGLGTGGIVFDKHIDKSTQQMNLKVHSYIFFTMIGVFKDVVAGSNAQHIFFTMNPSPLLL